MNKKLKVFIVLAVIAVLALSFAIPALAETGTVTTGGASAITQDSATLGGSWAGWSENDDVIEAGVFYSESEDPRHDNGATPSTTPTIEDEGTITEALSGLESNTKYYYNAYVKYTADGGAEVYAYGNPGEFTTLAAVTTNDATAITAADATLNGTIDAGGGATISERGFYYSTSTIDTENLDGLTPVTAGSGTGDFSYELTDLQEGNTYYYVAYAKNEDGGVSYGTEKTFTTKTLPVVVTNGHTAITSTGATLNGAVTSSETPIEAKGFYFKASATDLTVEQIIAGNLPVTGTGDDNAYTADLTGLTPGTTYYYVAYAENDGGVNYGFVESFTTTTDPVIESIDVYAGDAVDDSKLIATFDNITGDSGSIAVPNGQITLKVTTVHADSVTDDSGAFDADNEDSNIYTKTFAVSGDSPITITASNEAGGDPDSYTLTLQGKNTAYTLNMVDMYSQIGTEEPQALTYTYSNYTYTVATIPNEADGAYDYILLDLSTPAAGADITYDENIDFDDAVNAQYSFIDVSELPDGDSLTAKFTVVSEFANAVGSDHQLYDSYCKTYQVDITKDVADPIITGIEVFLGEDTYSLSLGTIANDGSLNVPIGEAITLKISTKAALTLSDGTDTYDVEGNNVDYTLTVDGDEELTFTVTGVTDSAPSSWTVTLDGKSTDCSITDLGLQSKIGNAAAQALASTYDAETSTYTAQIPNDLNIPFTKVIVKSDNMTLGNDNATVDKDSYSADFIMGQPDSPYLDASIMLNNDTMTGNFTVVSEFAQALIAADNPQFIDYTKEYTLVVEKDAIPLSIDKIEIYDGDAVDAAKLIETLEDPLTEGSAVVPNGPITLKIYTTNADSVDIEKTGEDPVSATYETAPCVQTLTADGNTLVTITANGSEQTDPLNDVSYALTLEGKDTNATLDELTLTGCIEDPHSDTALTPDVEDNTYTVDIPADNNNPFDKVYVDYTYPAGATPVNTNLTDDPEDGLYADVSAMADGDTYNAAITLIPQVASTLEAGDYLYDTYVKTYDLVINKEAGASQDADLASMGLKVSYNSGTETTQAYSPAFAADTLEYDVTVPFASPAYNTLHLTLTAADANASQIEVIGDAATGNTDTIEGASGTAEITLAASADTVDVIVTAEDGTTTKTYTINVDYAADSTLKTMGLKVSRGETGSKVTPDLYPSFSSTRYAYDVTVPYRSQPYNYLHLTLAATDSNAQQIYVEGYEDAATITGDSGIAVIALDTDDDTVDIIVTAADDTTKTYTLNIEYEDELNDSDDATLDDLTLNNGSKTVKLSPTFKARTTSYTASVASSVDEINVEWEVAEEDSEVKVYLDGKVEDTFDGSDDIDLDLEKGKNTIKLRVTAPDGDTIKTYTINVTRGESSENYLSDLALRTSSGSTLSYTPSFDETTYSYKATVPNSVTQVAVKATLEDSDATMKINNATVSDDTWSDYISLAEGNNAIQIRVTADDGSIRTYQVTVTREYSASTTKTLKLWIGSTTAHVGDTAVTLDAAPFLYKYGANSYTMVPVRFIGEQGLGATVNWDAKTKTVTIIKNGTYVYLTLGMVNPATGLDCPPVIKNNRIFVPVRYVATKLGCTVNYTSVNSAIVIVPGK
jgi:hypothetical protein